MMCAADVHVCLSQTNDYDDEKVKKMQKCKYGFVWSDGNFSFDAYIDTEFQNATGITSVTAYC